MDDMTLAPAEPAPVAPARWSPATRLGFRFSFCYFMLYALCCGNATIWETIPFHIGEWIENTLNWPFTHGAEWMAQHLFHVQGVGAKIHGGGSGDKAIDWISCGIMLAVAVAATLLWTALDRSRDQHPKLFGWMRFTLRLTLGVSMMGYGFAKLFPMQMMRPSLAVLNEPLGNSSPMTLLWTLIGLNPLYQMICGATEVVAGVLILFRRTALVGALLTAFVVTNVVLYNFFFDVPVKIYAAHLLLMALVVIAPDVRSLFQYFILHRPSVPTGDWMLPANRRTLRIETVCVVIVLALNAGVSAFYLGPAAWKEHKSVLHPPRLAGQWHVTSATLAGQPKPVPTGEGQPLTDIFIERTGRAMLRSADQVLWRGGVRVDEAKHTLHLGTIGFSAEYVMTQPDASHLVLTPTAKDSKDGTLVLTSVPLPSHYPLENRGFHLVNEWGLER